MKIFKNPGILFMLSALVLGFMTDLFLRQPIFGLNYTLFVFMWVAVVLLFSWKRSVISKKVLFYATLACANGLIVYFRAAPLVQFWSVIISLVFISLLALSVLMKDFNSQPLLARYMSGISHFLKTLLSLPQNLREHLAVSTNKPMRINKGIIYSTILAIVFLSLFSSADAIFGNAFSWIGNISHFITDFLSQFNLTRIFTIAFWSVVALTILLMLTSSKNMNQNISCGFKQTLSYKDSRAILWTLVIVFGTFVAVQLRYLFINSGLPEGFTYAEYARQGYGQLLIATILTSIIIKWLISSTQFKARQQKNTKITASILLALNFMILLSAWKRLSLYDAAYGWTWARFIALLGIISIALGGVALLLWIWNKLTSRNLYAASWYIVSGVLMFAAISNPDAIIAQKNIAKLSTRQTALDVNYLASLSFDSKPTICHESQRIAKSHPAEYDSLKQRLISNQISSNHGLARHYTLTNDYTKTIKNCF